MFLLTASICNASVNAGTKVYPAARASMGSFDVNGGVWEKAWRKSPLVGGFEQWDSPEAPGVPMYMKVAYTGEQILVGLVCVEPNMAELTASKRDVFAGENVKVFFKTASGTCYGVAVNPAGGLQILHGGISSSAVRAAARLYQDRWHAEIAINLREVGIDPSKEKLIAFNVCRNRYLGGSHEAMKWTEIGGTQDKAYHSGYIAFSPSARGLWREAVSIYRRSHRPIVVYGPFRFVGGLEQYGRRQVSDRMLGLYRLEEEIRGLAEEKKRLSQYLQVLYIFQEPVGTKIHDIGGDDTVVNLDIDANGGAKLSGGVLQIQRPALIASPGRAQNLVDACRKAGELTVEAWIKPANLTQEGPARIVTLSADASRRNFTLGQQGTRFVARLRTTETSDNGIPSLQTPEGAVKRELTHVAYTRDRAGVAKLYVNGEEVVRRRVGGNLSNWDRGFRLALANELTQDRPWLGEIHRLAIYSHALDAGELQQNVAADEEERGREGGGEQSSSQKKRAAEQLAQVRQWRKAVAALYPHDRFGKEGAWGRQREQHLVALYAFDHETGRVIRDLSPIRKPPLDLFVRDPRAVLWMPDCLIVREDTVISSRRPATEIINRCRRSGEISIEVWGGTLDKDQDGPARIVTLSKDPLRRNFTLGQSKGAYVARLRTTRTSPNGTPAVETDQHQVQQIPTHLVYTRDRSGKAAIYVSNHVGARRNVPGDLSNWDETFRLALGNELTGDRPWHGMLAVVAIYDISIEPWLIGRHCNMGPCDAVVIGK